MATDPCKGLLTKYPANSPERAAQVKACFAQKKAKQVKSGIAKAPTTTTQPKSGNGGPNDPAWKGIADLAKNGLPG